MKALSALIEEYKVCPDKALKEEIFNRVIALKDLKVLDQEEPSCETGEWIIFDDNIRVKKIGVRKYLIADVFGLPGSSYLCYSYEVDLEQFTDAQSEGYRTNCSDCAEKAPDTDTFTAFAFAKSHDASASNTPYIAENESDLNNWYERL